MYVDDLVPNAKDNHGLQIGINALYGYLINSLYQLKTFKVCF